MRTDSELLALTHRLRKEAYEVMRPVLPALALHPNGNHKVASQEEASLQRALSLHQHRP